MFLLLQRFPRRIWHNASRWFGESTQPLQTEIFRRLWFASIVSNMGTWVHEIGAGWLMTSLDSSPSMVSAVRIAMTLPMIVLAIPMGLLADRVDRKRMLGSTAAMLLVLTTVLAVATFCEVITAWGLLGVTFLLGVAMVGHVLSWQSMAYELVPREQMSRAIALGSISFNLARATGPALGGLLIGLLGVWSNFSLNAISFAVVLLVLLSWDGTVQRRTNIRPLRQSFREGVAYCASRRPILATFARLSMFVLPASCVWSLLPLFVRRDLGWNPWGFGALVTMIGCGAVLAALGLHSTQVRLGFNRVVTLGSVMYAVAMGGSGWWVAQCGSFAAEVVVAPLMLVAGIGWMAVLTTLNSHVQSHLTSEYRGRGMSFYVFTFTTSMACGAWLWGRVATTMQQTMGDRSVAVTLALAGTAMALIAIPVSRIRIGDQAA
ncbi:MAG: MFS transporter [Planctomycetota bacterium]